MSDALPLALQQMNEHEGNGASSSLNNQINVRIIFPSACKVSDKTGLDVPGKQ
ncbi:TPA: hypothetical protein QCI71_003884 [Enterobacter chuandaensis]|uniref:hypothetical protein n=1 Tax=Enterobacter nematophilus TaxID=2994648 RepID=UPI0032F4A755|nr:hypothetical protein [Enterobacter chuandaensis]